MDKKGIISEHSKIKLELYRSYLELYLTVLLNSRRFREIHVHDIFAGWGVCFLRCPYRCVVVPRGLLVLA